jgi:hypothetical protein
MECIMGSGPGCQPMDIVSALQMTTELGMDNESRYAWAQVDVRQYYNNISPALLLKQLLHIGVPAQDCSLVVRLHALPHIGIAVDEWVSFIEHRDVGVLTGSRSASWLAILPIADAIIRSRAALAENGISFHGPRFVQQAGWEGAATGFDFEFHKWVLRLLLWRSWKMVCTDGGTCALRTAVKSSCALEDVTRISATCTVSLALGHVISTDGDCLACYTRTLRACWCALWANYKASCRTIGLKAKGRFFERAISSRLLYRAPRWQWSATVSSSLVKEQVRMIATLCRWRPLPAESWSDQWHRKKAFWQNVGCQHGMPG